MLTHASHSFSALTSWLFIGIRLSLKLSHWHDHSFCPIVLLFFLQQQGSRNLWLRKQVSVWCVADTASILFEMNVRAVNLNDFEPLSVDLDMDSPLGHWLEKYRQAKGEQSTRHKSEGLLVTQRKQ